MSIQKFATKSVHAGHNVRSTQGARAIPIYQTTSYVFDDCDHAVGIFNLSQAGYIYTRLNNPTNDILEQRLATLEGGIGAVVTSSGTAATTTTLLTLLKAGDHVVASKSLYGGTYNLLSVTLPRLRISTTFVDPENLENFEDAVQNNTRAIFIESVGNPRLDVLDIAGISKIAQQKKVPLIVDNTVPSPALLRPIEHGANIVIHSLTKYISGNGTSLGGVIVDAGNFDWTNGKFPEFTQPSPGYHGLVYSEALKEAAFIAKTRIEGLRDFGAALSPFNSFQILQGLETLSIRIQKHSENALRVAEWLKKQKEIAWVRYPGLQDDQYKHLAEQYLPFGASGIVTFGIKGGFHAAKEFVDSVKLFSLLANFGDTKSLIIHPASTTHQQLSAEEQQGAGVSADLIRLSIGLEDVEDIIADLEGALKKVRIPETII